MAIKEGMTREGEEVPEGDRPTAERSRDGGANRGLAKRMRAELVVAQIGALAMDRYLQGKSMRVIAEELGTTVRVVSDHVKAGIEAFREEKAFKAAEYVLMELAKLDAVELTAHEAFTKSQGEDGKRPGDPRFLATALQCSDRRRELLGLHGGIPDERDAESFQQVRDRQMEALKGTFVGAMLAGSIKDPFADPAGLEVEEQDAREKAVLDGTWREVEPTVAEPRPEGGVAADQGAVASPTRATPPAVTVTPPAERPKASAWSLGEDVDDSRMGRMERATGHR